MPLKRSSIVIRHADGSVSYREIHEAILSAVDDTPLRIRSAQRMMRMGLTRAEVETVFKVKLPPDKDKSI